MLSMPSQQTRRNIILSSSGLSDDHRQHNKDLPPSDPPSESSDFEANFDNTSEGIPLLHLLHNEVEKESSPFPEFVTPMQ
jgi:hypothetical protein